MYPPALFWIAFNPKELDDIYADPDDLEMGLKPELTEFMEEVAQLARQRGWVVGPYDLRYYDDRPPSDILWLPDEEE